MKLSIKKGDNVLVLTGKDAGKTGEILEVNAESGKVIVAGVNVQVVCPVCKKAVRVAHKIEGDNKVRVCKKCGAVLEAKKAAKSSKKA